jgi:hypothetical protein
MGSGRVHRYRAKRGLPKQRGLQQTRRFGISRDLTGKRTAQPRSEPVQHVLAETNRPAVVPVGLRSIQINGCVHICAITRNDGLGVAREVGGLIVQVVRQMELDRSHQTHDLAAIGIGAQWRKRLNLFQFLQHRERLSASPTFSAAASGDCF